MSFCTLPQVNPPRGVLHTWKFTSLLSIFRYHSTAPPGSSTTQPYTLADSETLSALDDPESIPNFL